MPSQKVITQCLEWLYNQPSPIIFTLKEFEKRYKKVKSMTSAQFKELLDYLIMEDKLNVVKCGSINVYYLYVNVTLEKDKLEFTTLQMGNNMAREELGKVRIQYEKLLKTHSQNTERDELLQKYKSLIREVERSKRQLIKLENESTHWDEAKVQIKLEQIEQYKDKLSLHADNIENLIDYISKEYMVRDTQIREEFNVPDEFKIYI